MSERPGSPAPSGPSRLSEPRIRIVCGSPPSVGTSCLRSTPLIPPRPSARSAEIDEHVIEVAAAIEITITIEAARKRGHKRLARGVLPFSSGSPGSSGLVTAATAAGGSTGGLAAAGTDRLLALAGGAGAQAGERCLLGLGLVGEPDRLGLDRVALGGRRLVGGGLLAVRLGASSAAARVGSARRGPRAASWGWDSSPASSASAAGSPSPVAGSSSPASSASRSRSISSNSSVKPVLKSSESSA